MKGGEIAPGVDGETRLDAVAGRIAAAQNVSFETRRLARFAPTAFDAALRARLEGKARRRELSTRRLFSGAGHDAQMLARICPAAMIFVPGVGGISHNVTEFTQPHDLPTERAFRSRSPSTWPA